MLPSSSIHAPSAQTNPAGNKDGERETPNAFRIESGKNLRTTAAAVVANEIHLVDLLV
jgi:hypothetical protein